MILEIGGNEYFDEKTETFVTPPKCTLQLEHSLLSVSRWESKWEIPFMSDKTKTREQSIDYIRCMTIHGAKDPTIYEHISAKQIREVDDYIAKKMTATTITHRGPKRGGKQIITSELIYYWMSTYGIPFDPCEKWHLNRLLMLIEVASAESGPKKKMSPSEIIAQNRALNKSRKAGLKTKG